MVPPAETLVHPMSSTPTPLPSPPAALLSVPTSRYEAGTPRAMAESSPAPASPELAKDGRSDSAAVVRGPSVVRRPNTATLVSRTSTRRRGPAGRTATAAVVDKLKEQHRLSRQRSLRRSKDADFYAKIENTINYKDRDPKKYLDYLKKTHPKTELGTLLARKDGFHEALLQTYMSTLDFENQPLDIALRVLLGQLHLPKETQQIDRIIHGFAKRYHESNPQLFESADTVYALAFSLMLLHTDAHNVHVKHKMTKDQYVKMAREMDSSVTVPTEVLDILYDNITSLQFVYADQSETEHAAASASASVPVVGSPSPGPTLPSSTPVGASAVKDPLLRPSTSSSSASSILSFNALTTKLTSLTSAASSTSQLGPASPAPPVLTRAQSQSTGSSNRGVSWVKNKLLGRSPSNPLAPRPIALMQQVTTAMLSPKVGPHSPSQSPYSYHGTQSILRDAIMRGVFKMHVPIMRPYMNAVGGRPHPNLALTDHAAGDKPEPTVTVLRCAKEGFLVRKVDILENGKRAPVRTWKDFWVVLSGSQLLLFRNIDWFRNPKNRMLNSTADSDARPASSTSPFGLNPFSFSRDQSIKYSSVPPKPHTIIPTVNGVCVLDSDYTKYPYVFRFVAGDGRQYLFRASSDDDVDDWMAKINYAAAFKTLEVATRGAATPTITVDSDQWSKYAHSVDGSSSYRRKGSFATYTSKLYPAEASSGTKLPARLRLGDDMGGGGVAVSAPSSVRSLRHASPTACTQLSFSPPTSPRPGLPPAGASSAPSISAGSDDQAGQPLAVTRSVTTQALAPPTTASSAHEPGRESQDTLRERIAFFSRREILKTKIKELEQRIAELKRELHNDLTLHQQIAIMVPFQKSTRQRATVVIDNLRQRIKRQFLTLQKFECYCEILETDLEIEIELERGEWE
ncbi:hypothetical protein H4R34_000794 [Dimargaris verticillata]|uniref:SEC7 domain-containing protein n=1 Tax=Dimargaris verticillata TaxID=2761393 RepID=A0A9W8EBJ4_9FUNG|nr:hypothetical protein H4R34_000794 [Dimargaris verticillata]